MSNKKQYIGTYEIESTSKVDEHTVAVTFYPYTNKDGDTFVPAKQIISEDKFYNAVTDEPIDMTTLREKIYSPLVDKIIEVIADYGVHIGVRNQVRDELGFVLNKVSQKVLQWRFLYEDRLWGAEEEEKTLRDLMEGLKNTQSSEMRSLEHVRTSTVPKDPV